MSLVVMLVLDLVWLWIVSSLVSDPVLGVVLCFFGGAVIGFISAALDGL